MRSRLESTLGVLCLAASGCHGREPSADGGAPPEVARSSAPPLAAPPSLPGPTPGPKCASDANCTAGKVCFFSDPGCDPNTPNGHCEEPSWGHECAVNRPVCGCDGQTMWGNACADIQRRRWAKLGGCACKADSDCKGGQVCNFRERGCESEGMCEAPERLRCPGKTTLCSCRGKSLTDTCAQAVREPWVTAGACP